MVEDQALIRGNPEEFSPAEKLAAFTIVHANTGPDFNTITIHLQRSLYDFLESEVLADKGMKRLVGIYREMERR